MERSRTNSGAPSRRAYTRCAEAHQANEAPRVVAVTATTNLSDADADLSPDQNLLVPAIIATAIQLSYFCVHL